MLSPSKKKSTASATNDAHAYAQDCFRVFRHRVLGRRRGRFGNHGRTSRRRQRRDRTSRQHLRHRRSARRFNSHVRANLRCAFESRRHHRGRHRARRVLDGGRLLRARTMRGSDRRRNRSAPDVRPARDCRVSSCAERYGSGIRRICRNVRIALRHLGLLAPAFGAVPFAVAAYITAAYWFTSSTSFANPAVTVARSLSDTFVGIRPMDVPLFVAAQLAGALAATLLFRWLVPQLNTAAKSILVSQ